MALTQVPVSMVDFSVNPTLSGGTANGVAYLNGSKVVTTGSALTFDGTNLGLSSSAVATAIKIDGSGRYKQFETYQSGSREFYFGYDSTSLIGLIYQDNNRPIAFGISGSEQMRLTSTGLGIGTSSPSQKLTVSGSAAFSRIGFNANAIDTVSTSQSFVRFQSTGADFYLGTESSTGGAFFPGSTAYAAVLYNANSTPMHFYTNAGLRMTLDSSGNLGIGTTSPSARLNVSGGDLFVERSDYPIVSLYRGTTRQGYLWSVAGSYFELVADSRPLFLSTGGANYIATYTNGSERARFTSSGNFAINCTGLTNDAPNVAGGIYTSTNGNVKFRVSSDGVQVFQFYSPTGGTSSPVGSVSVNASSVAYNTSSDYRLKDNIAPMTGALAKVAALKPVTYKWKVDGSDGEGFIAHELQAICPDAVTGQKDAVDAEGKPVYQGIDTSFLVATLTAAIQELKAEFDAYKSTHP